MAKYRITGLPKAQKGVQKAQKTGDGFYTFQGTNYMKKGDEWFKEINGKYLPLTKGDVAKRSAVLDKQAHKLSPYEIQERERRAAGISKYDPLETFKPQVASTTNVVSTVKPLPAAKKKPVEQDLENKLLASYLVESGKAINYLGDKYWEQSDPQSLNELMLAEIRKNPKIMDDINENEYKLWLERDKKARDQQSLGYTIANNISAFLSDPVATGANWMKGEGALMDQGTILHDPNDPNYQNAMRAAGADTWMNQGLNLVNPVAYVADARVAANKGNYGEAALRLGEGLFMAPKAATLAFKGGKEAFKGVNKVLNYTPKAIRPYAPWANLQNTVVNPYFGYEAVTHNIPTAIDAFSEGDWGKGLEETAWGTFGVLPYVKPAIKTARTLTTPGTVAGFETAVPVTGAYKSPFTGGQSGALINPWDWSNRGEQILPGFTSAYNKYLGPTLGEFELYKTGAKAKNYGQTADWAPAAIGEGVTSVSAPGRQWNTFHETPRPRTVEPVTNLDEFFTSNLARPKGSPRKAFEEDLKNDPDFQAFTEDAKIPEAQQTKRLNDSYDILGKVLESYGVPVATKDYKNFQTLSEDQDIIGISSAKKAGSEGVNEETAIELMNSAINNRLDFWKSEEGQRRLQNLIDNTSSLQGQTPATFINKVENAANWTENYVLNKEALEDLNKTMQQIDVLYEEGKISENDYFNISVQYDQEAQMIEKNIALLERYIEGSSAFWGVDKTGKGVFSLNPKKFQESDISLAMAHELTHPLQTNFLNLSPGPNYLDHELGNLDLIDLGNTSQQLEIPMNEVGPSAYTLFGPGNQDENYLAEAMDYFLNGSGGRERTPFLAEVREDMLRKGIIKSEADKITPKMLKDHYNDYKKVRGEKYPLRLYDIMQDTKKNFNLLSEVVNNLPMVIGATAAGAELLSDDEITDDNVSNAAMIMLLGRFGKGKGAASLLNKLQRGEKIRKTPVVGAMYTFMQNGWNALPKNKQKLLNNILDTQAAKIEMDMKGMNLPWEYLATTQEGQMNTYLTQAVRDNLLTQYYSGTLPKNVEQTYVNYGKAILDKMISDGIKQFGWQSTDPEPLDINALPDDLVIRDPKITGYYKQTTIGEVRNYTDKDYFEIGANISNREIDFKGRYVDLSKKLGAIEDKIIKEISKAEDFFKEEYEVYAMIQDLVHIQEEIKDLKHAVKPYEVSSPDASAEIIALENNLEQIFSTYPHLREGVKVIENGATITDLRTGQKIPVGAAAYNKVSTYTILQNGTNEELVKVSKEISDSSKTEIAKAVGDNVQATVEALPGSKPYGSSILVSEGGVPHLSSDVDVMMIDTDLQKIGDQYRNFGKKSDTSPAIRIEVFPQAGAHGLIDVNLIHTGPDGLAIDDPDSTVKHATTIFRQFFPIEYAQEAKAATLEQRPIKIPFTPQQLMERFDPFEKSIMDAYGSNPDANLPADKQRYRADVIVSFAKEEALDKVASAQQKYIQSVVGEKGSIGVQFPEEALSDYKKNMRILNLIDYPGAREIIAANPKRMQLALNDYYIHQTTHVRQVHRNQRKKGTNYKEIPITTHEQILPMINEWRPDMGGGTASGWGLNNQNLGPLKFMNDPNAIQTLRQINLRNKPTTYGKTSDLSDPLGYVEQIRYETGQDVFTNEQLEILNKIKGNIIKRKPESDLDPVPKIIKDIMHDRQFTEYEAKEFLELVNEHFGISTLIDSNIYGLGFYSSSMEHVNESIDGLIYTTVLDRTHFKSWYQRQRFNRGADLIGILANNPNKFLPLKTVEDFKKIQEVVTSGIGKLETRERAFQAELNTAYEKYNNAMERFKQGSYMRENYYNEMDKINAEIKEITDQYDRIREQKRLLEDQLSRIQNVKQDLAVFLAAGLSIGGVAAFTSAIYNKNSRSKQKQDLKYKKTMEEAIRQGVGNEFMQKYAIGNDEEKTMQQYKSDWNTPEEQIRRLESQKFYDALEEYNKEWENYEKKK